MIDGHRLCLTIPAGRRRYMQVLVPQILREGGWDELQVWVNTCDPEDLAYLASLPSVDPRIRLVALPDGMTPQGSQTIHHFFANCMDPQTVYIRLDDDICFIEPGALARIARYRLASKQAFLVFPVIVNNAIISHVLQVLGRIRYDRYLRALCMDPIGWKSPEFAERLHRSFLRMLAEGRIDQFKFPSRPIALSRMSINCIAWLGEEFAKFGGKVGPDEEEWLSVVRPTQIGGHNLIFGDAIVSHFAFYTQREYLDRTDLLELYRMAAGI